MYGMKNIKLEDSKKPLIEKTKTPLDYIECMIAFDGRDWDSDNQLAAIYAITLGWDDITYKELKENFNWSDLYIAKLKYCHEIWEQLKLKIKPRQLNYKSNEYDDDGNLMVYDDSNYCPMCGKEFDVNCTKNNKYCLNCGQALDWGDVDEE